MSTATDGFSAMISFLAMQSERCPVVSRKTVRGDIGSHLNQKYASWPLSGPIPVIGDGGAIVPFREDDDVAWHTVICRSDAEIGAETKMRSMIKAIPAKKQGMMLRKIRFAGRRRVLAP